MGETPALPNIFLAIYSAFRLEVFPLKLRMNHFQLRAKIYMAGLKASLEQLKLRTYVAA